MHYTPIVCVICIYRPIRRETLLESNSMQSDMLFS